jgi:membrane associated rhomboid family serine protease
VKAAAKTRAPVRTVFGGRVVGERPTATYTLIGVTVATFVLQLVLGARFTNDFAFWSPVALEEPWRFVTAGFLHSPSFLLHIAFNMLALWMVGPYLERLFGRVRFTAVYLLSAVGGSVGYFVIVPAAPQGGWMATVVGASGAVFGLFGALLVANRRLQRDNGPLIGLLVINAVFGFVVAAVAWQAHLGGFVTGAACAAVLASPSARRKPPVQAAGLVAVLLALVALVLLKAALAPPELLL